MNTLVRTMSAAVALSMTVLVSVPWTAANPGEQHRGTNSTAQGVPSRDRKGADLRVFGAELPCFAWQRLLRTATLRCTANIRAGFGRTIVEVRPGPAKSVAEGDVAAMQYPHPRPRLAGFSPLIAITTSNKRSEDDIDYEHDLEASYVGDPLDPNTEPGADPDFVIGYLDSGAVVDLAAGSAADLLGLGPFDGNLTTNTVPIGGVGGTVDAWVSQPIGFFAVGLSAVDEYGLLDFSAMVGHSNVSTLAAPSLDCGGDEALTAVVGTPFLAFYNTIIRVDTPQTVTVGGETYTGPDVQIQQQYYTLPTYARAVAIEFGGLSPVLTASYFPDFEDLRTPIFPTQLSFSPLSVPLGGAFFATIQVLEGEPGPTNPAQSMRVMVDTGAQSSIMSPAMAASLNLPMEPDFTVSVCGVGGLVEDVPGYYIDYVKISAWGGALEFSRAPFVVLDLESPEGGSLNGVLGMNFFWNRNVILEPALSLSGFLHVSDPIPFAYADFDLDFDVDAFDAETFVSCLTGPGPSTLNPECDHIDGNVDGAVDLADFRQFQLCFSGPDTTADTDCGN